VKILSVVGNRLDFIKANCISKELKKYKSLKEIIVNTGKKFDANKKKSLRNKEIISYPKYNLNEKELKNNLIISQIIIKLEKVILKENPKWIIIFGDTNSTLAGAIVANKLKKKLAYVDAGIRSNNKNIPEEINRIIIDRLSNLLFCSEELNKQNLILENFDNRHYKVVIVGNLMNKKSIGFSSKIIKEIIRYK